MIRLVIGGSFDVFKHYEQICPSEPRDWIPFLWLTLIPDVT